ncbi:MAG: hypothetical protein H6742_09550 [Alphaproteobacteria bacterium]|nr:hypothetical protein [Alphaproteobacteria bacterium]
MPDDPQTTSSSPSTPVQAEDAPPVEDSPTRELAVDDVESDEGDDVKGGGIAWGGSNGHTFG